MKKITLIVMLCLYSFVGYSQLTENFDGTTAPPDASSGLWNLSSGNWLVRDNMQNAPFNWDFNSAIYPANSGTQAAFMQRENFAAGTTSEEWLITPQVTLPINQELRFFTRQTLTGDTGTKYQIRVSSSANPADLSAYTILTEFTETTLSSLTPTQLDYEQKVVALPFSGARFIAFVKVFTATTAIPSGDRWLIDDVQIVEKCNNPTTLGTNNVSAYGATLTWLSTAATFDIEYGLSGFTPGTGTIITNLPNNTGAGNSNSYVITPPLLTPSTSYQFYVTAHCATGTNSERTGPFNWLTSPLGSTCDGPIVITNPLPYSDSGDTLQFGNNINQSSQGTVGCGATGNFLAGNDVVYSYTVPATTTGLISIQMNPLGTSNTGVFVYSSCDAIGNSCLAGVGNGNSIVRSIPALPVVAGQTIFIVISSNFETESFDYTLILQDVNCAPPSDLSATGTGPTSANLSWQNPGNASQWEVFVQTAGSAIPATAGTVTATNVNFEVTSLTESATALQLGVSYQYWVRANCGNGTFSAWSGPYLFNTTSCSSGCNYIFQMTDSFSDGWTGNTMSIIQNGITITTIGADFQNGGEMTVSVPLCDGPFQLYWNAGGSFPGDVGISIVNSFNQIIYTKPPFEGQQNSLLFEGIVNCSIPECLAPTNLVSSNATAFTAVLEWTPNGPNPQSWNIYVVPVGDAPPTSASTPYANTTQNPYTVENLLPDTQYVYYVSAVCSATTTSGISQPSEIFSTIPTCPRPTGLTITNPSLDSVVFNWTAGGTETQWEYIVLGVNSTEPAANDPNWLAAPIHPFTINGLLSGTGYDFYVRAVCSDLDKSKPAKITGYTTVCAPELQCAYTFTLSTLFGSGWDGNIMTVLQNGVPVAFLGPQFTEGNGPFTVSVPLCPGFVFDLFWNNVENVFDNGVGVIITNPQGQILFTQSPFENQSGTTLYSNTAQCTIPTCIAPSGLTIANVGLDTMTVVWNDNNTPAANSWDILVLPANNPPPTPDSTGWVTVTGGIATYSVSNLTAGTNYKVYVRSICSDSEKSFWSVGKAFSTLVCPQANVCDYTFTMQDEFGDSWNGNTMNVIQNGQIVAVLTGPTFVDGTDPATQVVSLCNDLPFELFWTDSGFFALEVKVSISNQVGTVIFTHDFGNDLTNTTLFSGTVNCTPATCPKPAQLYVYQITQTSATLGWTETGSATQWEYFITTSGSPPPSPTTPGILVADNPINVNLLSGTSYVFYVRSICSSTDSSSWSLPATFATLITNDECANATAIPVNPDQSCAQIVSGTITGATASNVSNSCTGIADDDVWFSFIATGTAHSITLSNFTGSTQNLSTVLYQGSNCNALTEINCSLQNQSFATGLTVGQTYYIRIYSFTGIPNQTATFDICIGTIASPISASTTLYTAEELVRDVLINSTCAAISDITFSTGTNFNSTNGIGYFNKEASLFPFQNGIVLSTGNADSVAGPNTDILADGDFGWEGDADLQAVLSTQGISGTLSNATSLEFNFVPLINSVSFNFLFASEEYGTFQCDYSDAFAFLLTNTETNVTTNLAVIPNTTIPVSTTTIHNGIYNPDCGDANAEYFGTYYLEPGEDPLSAPINFNGITVPLTAFSQVTPGVQYHIKMVIADFGPFGQDNSFDSAVFLQGGSFGIGDIDLGNNFLETNGTAVCAGSSQVIDTSLDPAIYTFSWAKDGVTIVGETSSSLTVTEEGSYTITAEYAGSVCSAFQTVVVEFYDPILPGTAANLTICDPSATAEFNLTLNQSAILAPLNGNFTLTYFTSEAEAIAGIEGAIGTIESYSNISNPQTIYVRAQNNVTGCYAVTNFQLIVQDLTPQFTLPSDFAICSGSSSSIVVTPINFSLDEVTYSWTLNSVPLTDVTSSITVNSAGLYEVTINRSGCIATAGVNVTVVDQIIPTFDAIATICQGSVAPILPIFSTNNVAGMWTPATISTNSSGTFEYCFLPNADQSCAVSTCIQVVVNDAPIITVSDVFACNSYSLPELAVGGYFTSINGEGPVAVGTVYPAGSITTLYVYAQGGSCSAQKSFTINVGSTPIIPEMDDVVVCSEYTLPVQIPADNIVTYYTEPNAGGQILTPGTILTSSQTIYLYTSSLVGTQVCTSESSFTVTVGSGSEFNIQGECDGTSFVLSVMDGSSISGEATYQWLDANGNVIAGATSSSVTVSIAGTYSLVVTTDGCSVTESFMANSISCMIQRGISPRGTNGGDGKNDYFDLEGLNVQKLEIFNRYGTRVYGLNNYRREWYGQSDKGDELPDGTYFYVIARSGVDSVTGWIYINREK